MNNLLLDALKCQNHARPPVWLMRQAGRYMPSYRALRSKHSFLEMVHTPELAVEVTLMPIEQLNVDAAILFSDILVLIEALGLKLHFDDGSGPRIENPLMDDNSIANLAIPHIPEALSYVGQAISMLKSQLKVPLLGFCGAPFTLASYMIEGKTSRDWRKTKQWMLKNPGSFHNLLTRITQSTIDYLMLQVQAGVQAVQIFDSWANCLAHTQFREFSLPYLKMIVDSMRQANVPTLVFCRGSSVFAPQLAEINPSAISLDWNCDLLAMRKQIPSHIALQGNLDPDILYASPQAITKEAERLLAGMKGNPGYIFNLGHGVLPDIPYENVKTLVEVVQCQTM